jgi:hypothetical protein
MKHELKFEFKDTKTLLPFIESCYGNGVLVDKTKKMTFDKTSHFYSLCKGLSNLAVRIWNDEIIDGTMRFIIEEHPENVDLYPCSIIYEMDNNKYSFII